MAANSRPNFDREPSSGARVEARDVPVLLQPAWLPRIAGADGDRHGRDPAADGGDRALAAPAGLPGARLRGIGAFKQGRLAQLVEHLVYTERVGGSSPSAPTIPLVRNRPYVADR